MEILPPTQDSPKHHFNQAKLWIGACQRDIVVNGGLFGMSLGWHVTDQELLGRFKH